MCNIISESRVHKGMWLLQTMLLMSGIKQKSVGESAAGIQKIATVYPVGHSIPSWLFGHVWVSTKIPTRSSILIIRLEGKKKSPVNIIFRYKIRKFFQLLCQDLHNFEGKQIAWLKIPSSPARCQFLSMTSRGDQNHQAWGRGDMERNSPRTMQGIIAASLSLPEWLCFLISMS